MFVLGLSERSAISLTIRFPSAIKRSSRLSSVMADAEKLLPMSRKVGMPPVSNALSLAIVMVGTSALNLNEAAEVP